MDWDWWMGGFLTFPMLGGCARSCQGGAVPQCAPGSRDKKGLRTQGYNWVSRSGSSKNRKKCCKGLNMNRGD